MEVEGNSTITALQDLNDVEKKVGELLQCAGDTVDLIRKSFYNPTVADQTAIKKGCEKYVDTVQVGVVHRLYRCNRYIQEIHTRLTPYIPLVKVHRPIQQSTYGAKQDAAIARETVTLLKTQINNTLRLLEDDDSSM